MVGRRQERHEAERQGVAFLGFLLLFATEVTSVRFAVFCCVVLPAALYTVCPKPSFRDATDPDADVDARAREFKRRRMIEVANRAHAAAITASAKAVEAADAAGAVDDGDDGRSPAAAAATGRGGRGGRGGVQRGVVAAAAAAAGGAGGGAGSSRAAAGRDTRAAAAAAAAAAAPPQPPLLPVPQDDGDSSGSDVGTEA